MEHHFGRRLAEARASRELSQEALARSAKVSGFTISKYERGVLTNPGAETLEKLAAALNVSPAWLLTGEGKGPKRKRAA